MRNSGVSIGVAVRAGACFLLLIGSALGQEPVTEGAQAKTPEKPPVKRVVVSATGVAFIEHEGKVIGNKELLLDLPDRDVNDLLKSMVTKDLGGGRVSWAALPTVTSKSSPISLGERRSLTELLLALRGMRIRIGSAAPVEGELLLVEGRAMEPTKENIPQATLLTASGIVRVDVKNDDTVQLVDEVQRRAMSQSAELLDSTRDSAATRVRLKCEGEGERQLRVGYVAAMPIWKASYRLVLREEGKSLLQAWALIENDTQSDWKEIECTIVSGRSLGFQTDLRKPLNIKRPYRAPERYAAIAPETHKPGVEARPETGMADAMAKAVKPDEDATDSLAFDDRTPPSGMGGMGGMGLSAPTEMVELLNRRLERWRAESSHSNSSIAQAAQGGILDTASTLGESIHFRLKGTVSVAKGETALLHLLDAELDGKEVAIFNPSMDAVHPLHAVYATNTSGGALAGGPVSIYSGDAYRGDALVSPWPAGAKRLLSYAVDTQATVRWENADVPLEFLGAFVTEENEVVFLAKESLDGKYIVENRGAAMKSIWIEHPRFLDWTLVEPKKIAETTVDRYRLEIEAEPRKEVSLPVSLSRYRLVWPEEATWRLSKKEIDTLPALSDSVRELLRNRIAYATKQDDASTRHSRIEEELEEMKQEQERLRSTIGDLEKFPEQAKPLIEKLLDLEKQREGLLAESKKAARFMQEAEFDPEATEETKAFRKMNDALIPKIKTENPLDKLPYKPNAKEIKAWRNRIQRSQYGGGMGGMGMGGMGGGMGGGFF